MTLYKNHPFVEDADKEVEQKKKEDEEKEQVYPPNFNKDNSDDNSKDGELNE